MKQKVSRREFLLKCALYSGSTCLGLFPGSGFSANNSNWFRYPARWYKKLPEKQVKCQLCPRECVVDDRERGYCGVRENRNGTYYTLVYGRPCTYHIDPIEKKPLFHFLPASTAFSLATAGCNVNCKFCQNWEISQSRPEQIRYYELPPDKIVKMARELHCRSIAFTYSEPVVFSEYVYDIAEQARSAGIYPVMISNGYIRKEPLLDLCQVLSGIKIDLKAITEKFYREVVSGELRPVLDSLVEIKKQGNWLEIVYLVIPGLNDSEEEFHKLSQWLSSNLGKNVPIHFTRFYPQYLLTNLPPTPLKTLETAVGIARSYGLKHVYLGNVPGHKDESTYCSACQKILIKRWGFKTEIINLQNGQCANCGATIPGVW
ncbi:MAG: AmmeMemoRadiSam system radical SAM enzyme [Calditrichia bacterium]